MRHAAKTVFDEHVSGPNVKCRTSDVFSDLLGRYDQLSIQLVVDDVDADGTISLAIEHSADGVYYVPKTALPELYGEAITAGQTNLFVITDAGTTPSLTYVRLRVTLATTTRAYVKIHVTMRDEGIVDVVVKPPPHHHHEPLGVSLSALVEESLHHHKG